MSNKKLLKQKDIEMNIVVNHLNWYEKYTLDFTFFYNFNVIEAFMLHIMDKSDTGEYFISSFLQWLV
jgi:hypothetical protein